MSEPVKQAPAGAKLFYGLAVFWLVMTGLHLWQVGFPRLEGPEGRSWAKVISILLSYVLMAACAGGLAGIGALIEKHHERRAGGPPK